MCSLNKKYFNFTHDKHKPFWQLIRLGHFAVSPNVNLLIHEKLNNLPKTFFYYFTEESLCWETNEFSQMLVVTLWNKLSLLPKKTTSKASCS